MSRMDLNFVTLQYIKLCGKTDLKLYRDILVVQPSIHGGLHESNGYFNRLTAETSWGREHQYKITKLKFYRNTSMHCVTGNLNALCLAAFVDWWSERDKFWNQSETVYLCNSYGNFGMQWKFLCKAWWSLRTVSYTHLDVYKRQLSRQTILAAGGSAQELQLFFVRLLM